mmetsp:Transcript_48456/g.112289  ORF Transcript_48456/g.112289 Transcript_48456/m.112289 type:complete len:393 (+) Transcript_48456:138-1316(+)
MEPTTEGACALAKPRVPVPERLVLLLLLLLLVLLLELLEVGRRLQVVLHRCRRARTLVRVLAVGKALAAYARPPLTLLAVHPLFLVESPGLCIGWVVHMNGVRNVSRVQVVNAVRPVVVLDKARRGTHEVLRRDELPTGFGVHQDWQVVMVLATPLVGLAVTEHVRDLRGTTAYVVECVPSPLHRVQKLEIASGLAVSVRRADPAMPGPRVLAHGQPGQHQDHKLLVGRVDLSDEAGRGTDAHLSPLRWLLCRFFLVHILSPVLTVVLVEAPLDDLPCSLALLLVCIGATEQVLRTSEGVVRVKSFQALDAFHLLHLHAQPPPLGLLPARHLREPGEVDSHGSLAVQNARVLHHNGLGGNRRSRLGLGRLVRLGPAEERCAHHQPRNGKGSS